jgi:hypothetical protein
VCVCVCVSLDVLGACAVGYLTLLWNVLTQLVFWLGCSRTDATGITFLVSVLYFGAWQLTVTRAAHRPWRVTVNSRNARSREPGVRLELVQVAVPRLPHGQHAQPRVFLHELLHSHAFFHPG